MGQKVKYFDFHYKWSPQILREADFVDFQTHALTMATVRSSATASVVS
jgi:hypothetical protein